MSSKTAIRSLFLPDWRVGNPYQTLLANALADQSIEVVFPNGRKRGMPLLRATHQAHPDIVHLHWPEGFLDSPGTAIDIIRLLRLPFDLSLVTRRTPVVLTVHNLIPHNRHQSAAASRLCRRLLNGATRVICHSEAAGEAVSRQGTSRELIDIIPHGDLLDSLPPLSQTTTAKRQLNLPLDTPICLVFGAIKSYKGILELLELWHKAEPAAALVVIGKTDDPSLASKLEMSAKRSSATSPVIYREGFVDDQDLASYLSAADLTLFNYQQVFTSGGAALARSAGLPIVITERAVTIGLQEPDPSVIRFADTPASFLSALQKAIELGKPALTQKEWLDHTAWERIAELTAITYRKALASAD